MKDFNRELDQEELNAIEEEKSRIASTTTLAGRIKASQNGPKATSAWIENETLFLVLSTEATLCFPTHHLASLRDLTSEQLLEMRLVSGGQTLMWPKQGISISVRGIVEAMIGEKTMRSIGSKGGSVKTEAKSTAARNNGILGGRPKKLAA